MIFSERDRIEGAMTRPDDRKPESLASAGWKQTAVNCWVRQTAKGSYRIIHFRENEFLPSFNGGRGWKNLTPTDATAMRTRRNDLNGALLAVNIHEQRIIGKRGRK